MEDERLPAICGRATLATLVSSTSMNVASITVPAITHGLTSGFSTPSDVSCGIESLTASSLGQDRGLDIHSGAKHRISAGNGIEDDLHWNPLDHFHVVSARVLGRQ